MPGRLFVISGPSGVGKSTVIRGLRQKVKGLGFSVSHTSRPPRRGEKNGVHYHFVGEEAFQKMIEENAFVEWARVYQGFYGTSYASLEEQTARDLDVVLDIDTQGGANIRKHFKEMSVLIYLLPPSLEELERRLKRRATDDEEVINARLEKALNDIRNCPRYDYLVINENLNQAVREVTSIVTAERCRTDRRLPLVEKTFQLTQS